MSDYDEVSSYCIQIKCVSSVGNHYKIGDQITLPDGLYIGYEGWFVVKGFKVKTAGDKIFNKWGNEMFIKDIIDPSNSVVKAITRLEKKSGQV